VSPGLLLILSFAAGVLVVAGVASVLSDLVLKDRAAVDRRLNDEFRLRQREKVKESPLFRDLDRVAARTGDEESTAGRRLEAMLEQSGTGLTLARLGALTVGLGAGAAVLVTLLRQSPVSGLAAAALLAPLPYLYVRRKWAARMGAMARQLPDTFDLMSRVIRSGQTTEQAVQAVADEFDQPVAGEFSYCAEQQNLGLSPELAFRDLARRTGLLELKILVLALLIQQQTGGNLAEVLDKLAGVVRERFKMKAKIKALTAEGRMQGLFLLALPPALVCLLAAMNSIYAETLARNPGLLGVMVTIEVIGGLWIRKIVNFDF
jgi:tight adherence protein B